MANLATRVGSVELKSAVMTASGTSGHGAELAPYVDLAGLGAVVVKSLSVMPWPGNPAPRLHPVANGMINAVGLQGPGVDAWFAETFAELERADATVVVSIWGRSVDEYSGAAEAVSRGIARLGERARRIVAVEVNLSCPNLEERSAIIAHDAGASAAVIGACRSIPRPLWAKLSPNTDRVVDVVGAVVAAGAEAVTLINTVVGMATDPVLPVLGNGGGGLSGRLVHPIAVRVVHDVRAAHPAVPIIGVGGVTSGRSAAALIAAGAAAVQVGTASFADPRAVAKVARGLVDFLERSGLDQVSALCGAAHRGGIHRRVPGEE